jgi:hypothetical protein
MEGHKEEEMYWMYWQHSPHGGAQGGGNVLDVLAAQSAWRGTRRRMHRTYHIIGCPENRHCLTSISMYSHRSEVGKDIHQLHVEGMDWTVTCRRDGLDNG